MIRCDRNRGRAIALGALPTYVVRTNPELAALKFKDHGALLCDTSKPATAIPCTLYGRDLSGDHKTALLEYLKTP